MIFFSILLIFSPHFLNKYPTIILTISVLCFVATYFTPLYYFIGQEKSAWIKLYTRFWPYNNQGDNSYVLIPLLAMQFRSLLLILFIIFWLILILYPKISERFHCPYIGPSCGFFLVIMQLYLNLATHFKGGMTGPNEYPRHIWALQMLLMFVCYIWLLLKRESWNEFEK